MWKFVAIICILVSGRDARGQASELSVARSRCCAGVGGRSQAECESTAPPAPSAQFALCAAARKQCCTEHFRKKECESGIALASAGRCDTGVDHTRTCCAECVRGARAGRARGAAACAARPRATHALAARAYDSCCLKAAQEAPVTPHPVTTARKEKRENGATASSMCEEYAPTELCAHHCIPVPGSYRCECNPGYGLMADGRNCRLLERNRCRPHNPCHHRCNDNGVTVKCSCRRGYELMADGRSCRDLDECQLDMHVCRAGSVCLNLPGSYRCLSAAAASAAAASAACPAGYARNAAQHTCDDVDECALAAPPCAPHECVNTVGGYSCGGRPGDPATLPATPPAAPPAAPPAEERCPPGFALGAHDQCEDVDECAAHEDDCNRLSQFCVNAHGSFYCQDKGSKLCRPGFKVDPATGKCEDINECEDNSEVCAAGQQCVNQLGQYDCRATAARDGANGQCADGMRMNAVTHQCEDIDECTEGRHLCDAHQQCVNTAGAHECQCRRGYELDPPTGACVDVNECAEGLDACTRGTQRCDNTVGSYLCVRIASCGTGYILQHATGNCEDIDECALGIAKCYLAGADYQCMNIPGSFRCVKKRATTTTAAPDDDYYYVYEDSVEESDNETISQPEPPPPAEDVPSTEQAGAPPPPPPTATDPSPPPSSTTETQTTPKEEPRIEDNSVYHESGRDEFETSNPEMPPPQQSSPPTLPSDAPGRELETSVEQKPSPESPRPPEPEPESPRRRPDPTEPSITYSEPKEARPESPVQPEIVYKDPSEPSQHRETQISTYYETRNESPERPISNDIIPPEEQPTDTGPTVVLETEPSIIRLEPKEVPTYSPYRPAGERRVSPPYAVAGGETATVPAVRRPDGAVVIDTNDVRENTWTAVKVKPTLDCPVGFEPNDNGGCFDVDECASNLHSCSGLTESCRNTIGGYLCDCAAGFRRDPVTGACDVAPPPPPPAPPAAPRAPPPPPPPPLFSPTSSSTSTTTSTTTTTTTTTPPPPTTTPPTTPPTTTPKAASFWGYRDDRFLVTRRFRGRHSCDAGYQEDPATGRCEDIDECVAGSARCAAAEECVNTRGGYRCECARGTTLDRARQRCLPPADRRRFPPGYHNRPVYPVEPSPEVEPAGSAGEADVASGAGVAEPPEPGWSPAPPRCGAGYTLADDDTCVDVDECAVGAAACGAGAACTNLPGGYVCACAPGHARDATGACADVDECALAGNTPICSQHADCVNTAGSYRCQCHDGFRSAPVNDKVCVDVDECAEGGAGGAGARCEQRCTNVWGGYRCHCHRGYRLNPDNRTCSDVDECARARAKLPCVGRCVNEPGSFRCACPPGYRLAEDQRSCIDIDECETGVATCATGVEGDTSHVCFNTRGSYRCARIACPPGYRLESKHRCNKVERVCGAGDWACARQPSTISYNFITFVSNLYVPDSNVKLFTMRGPAWSQARMQFSLRLVDVNAPPSVPRPADLSAFQLVQKDNEGVMSLTRALAGPQSIELELAMELYARDQFSGIALAKIFIYVSEYDF